MEIFLDYTSNNPTGAMTLQMFQQQEELSASVSTLIDMHKFVQDSNLWENNFTDSAAQRITTFSLEFLFTPGLSLYSYGLVMWRQH